MPNTASRPSRQSQKPPSVFDSVPDSPTSDLASRNRIISKSRDRRSDPLGLNVIYEPDDPPTIDIIFVHGLGGTSQQTWSKNKDPALFWPKEWLPFERNISTARVLSFGYNAHFAASGSNIFNISDFATELLFGMKFGRDEQSNHLGVGQVSCLFLIVFGCVKRTVQVYFGNIWIFITQSSAICDSDIVQSTRSYESTNIILGASIVGLSSEPLGAVAQLQRFQPPVFMELPVACHRLTKLFNFRC